MSEACTLAHTLVLGGDADLVPPGRKRRASTSWTRLHGPRMAIVSNHPKSRAANCFAGLNERAFWKGAGHARQQARPSMLSCTTALYCKLSVRCWSS